MGLAFTLYLLQKFKEHFLNAFDFSGHPSSGCDEIRNEFIKAMGYSCQWILSAFNTNDHQHEEVSCIMTSKDRSSMVKETKGYKTVSLLWYILLCGYKLLGVTLCFCTGSYAAAAGRRFLLTR